MKASVYISSVNEDGGSGGELFIDWWKKFTALETGGGGRILITAPQDMPGTQAFTRHSLDTTPRGSAET